MKYTLKDDLLEACESVANQSLTESARLQADLETLAEASDLSEATMNRTVAKVLEATLDFELDDYEYLFSELAKRFKGMYSEYKIKELASTSKHLTAVVGDMVKIQKALEDAS